MTRWLWFLLGWVALAIAVVGIVLPLVPTTGPLLLAAVCFDRSSPRFHDWLLNTWFLGSYIRNYQQGRGLPMLQKTCTIGLLWVTIVASIVLAIDAWWGRVLLLAVAVGVTTHILTLPTYRPEQFHQ